MSFATLNGQVSATMADSSNRCCDLGVIDDPVDFSTRLGSARPFLERAGIIPTYRNPGPRIEPDAALVHQAPLEPPLPLPSLQDHLNGSPPPDRAQTYEWPHLEFEEDS